MSAGLLCVDLDALEYLIGLRLMEGAECASDLNAANSVAATRWGRIDAALEWRGEWRSLTDKQSAL